jgi:hypothetical protein
MTHKRLQVLLLIALSGCTSGTPGIVKICEQSQNPQSDFKYISDLQSINDEMVNQRDLLDSLDKKLNEELSMQIESMSITTLAISKCLTDSAVKYKTAVISCYHPPNPCPPAPDTCGLFAVNAKDMPMLPATPKTRFISFFTRVNEGEVELYKNGKLLSVLEDVSYDDLTKIRTVRMPKKLQLKSGDEVVLMAPIGYLDTANMLQKTKIVYKEIIR